MTRVAIIGAGAIGGWIGARLVLAGANVSILARGRTLEAIRESGLNITDGKRTQQAAFALASDQPEAIGRQDLVVIAVKAPALTEAAQAAKAMIGPDTLLLPMLNGVPWWFTPGQPLRSVDPDGSIAAALPFEQLIGCVVHASCSRSAPNVVQMRHVDHLILGEPRGGPSRRVAELASLFEGAEIPVWQSEEIRSAIWYKLWGNATINPLSALTRATADRLLEAPELRAFMLEAMRELAAIGAAIGCPIIESGEERMAVTARLGAFKTSMLQDVEARRPIELEALLGAPREIAQRHGVATPSLDLLYAQTRLLGQSLDLI